MSDEYKPISCDLHSQYEVWILRAQYIKLVWKDERDLSHVERVMPLDIKADSGNEFLYFQSSDAVCRRVRLDRIFRVEAIGTAI